MQHAEPKPTTTTTFQRLGWEIDKTFSSDKVAVDVAAPETGPSAPRAPAVPEKAAS